MVLWKQGEAYEMGINVVGYDIFWVLTNYWKHQLHNPKRLYDILKGLEPSKREYDEIKDILLHWDKVQVLFKNWKTDHYDRKPKPLDDDLGAGIIGLIIIYHTSYVLSWFSSYVEEESLYQNSIERVKDFKVLI